MKRNCPNFKCAFPENIIRDGKFRRKEDSKMIQRFRCRGCGARFSHATFSDAYRQKKRRINLKALELLTHNVSIRGSASILRVDKRTIERRVRFLGDKCRRLNERRLVRLKGTIHNLQIDDLITKENSKLKPLTVTIAVDEKRRTILAAEVSRIPAFGHLAKLAVKKYGHRQDEHFDGLTRVFQKIAPIVAPEVLIKSDEHNRYPGFISEYLPSAKHLMFKSERGCVAGQGELKKVAFDPLFTVNHTCAMLRASINRLIRRTWCTTKDPARLKDHLDIFIYRYNKELLARSSTPAKSVSS
jgi:transposase-like protein